MYPYGQPPGGQQGNNGYSQNDQFQQPYQMGQQAPEGYQNFMQQSTSGTPGVMGIPQSTQGLQNGMQTGIQSLQMGLQNGVQGFQPGLNGFQPGIHAGVGSSVQNVAPSTPAALSGAYIPPKRLSFITPEDQANFTQLFVASLSPGEQALSGDVARQILLRSGLTNNVLGDIWQLADTQRSGKLLFPEFCAAMYLCSRSMRGFAVPLELDPRIKKEVSDMVDEISFNVADSGPLSQANQFANLRQNQPQPSNFAMAQQTGFVQTQQTGFIQSQPTSYGLQAQQTGPFVLPIGSVQSQATGGFMPQTTGLMPQTTGLRAQSTAMVSGTGLAPQSTGMMPQSTGFASLQPQVTGPLASQITGPLRSQVTGMQSQPSGMQSQVTGMQPQLTGARPQIIGMQPQLTGLQPQTTGPLQPMPTGKPGQWGFSNAQTPGMDTFQNQFTPQATGSRAFVMQRRLQQQVGSNQPPSSGFGMSKEEKQTYDGIFRQWDAKRSGYIDGQTAIKIFGKSGLREDELAQIWTLCDGQNQGKLNKDEFSVAMHLIYRKLNGQDIPLRLPPELVPPSQQRINESLEKMKKFLKDSKSLKVSKPEPDVRKTDASVFKNDDNDLGAYKSASRYRSVGSFRPPAQSSSSKPALNLEKLEKQVREKLLLLEAADIEEADQQEADKMLEAQNALAIDDLKARIRSVQEQISAKHGMAGNDAEKADLLRKLEQMGEELPRLIQQIRHAESEISSIRIDLMQKKFEKEHPTAKINGTGQNGMVTESDRAAAKRKAELRARMAAITGKAPSGSGDAEAIEQFEKQLAATRQQAETDSINNEKLLSGVEQTLKGLEKDLRNQLKGTDDPQADHDRRKWEEAIGVEPEVRDFILEIRRMPSQLAQTNISVKTAQTAQTSQSLSSVTGQNYTPAAAKKETTAERIARIRAEAQRRTQEKFAKAGITIGDRRKYRDAESKREPTKAEPTRAEQTRAEPVKVESTKAEPVKADPIKVETVKAEQTEPEHIQASPINPKQAAESLPQIQPVDDEDEEEKQLKLELEAERKRAAEIDAARARRKTALLAERDRLRKQGQRNSEDDEWDDAKPAQAKTWTPRNKAAETEPKKEAPKAESIVKRPSWMPKEIPKFNQETQFKASAQAPTTPSQPSIASQPHATSAEPPSTAVQGSFNPFRLQFKTTTNDDDWGSNASEAEDEEEDTSPRGGATAQQLASLLFGSMGPQRPEAKGPVSIQTAAPPPAAYPAQPAPQAFRTSEGPAEPLATPPAPPISAPPAAPAFQEEPYHQHEQYQGHEDPYNASQQQVDSFNQPAKSGYEHTQPYDPEANGIPSAPPPPPPVPAPAIPGPWPQDPSEDEFEFTDAPMAPSITPPAHPSAPPASEPPMQYAPPLPPPVAPPVPAGFAPPPPPGAPPAFAAPDASAPSGVVGLGNALLGEISSGGFKLKKPSQQHISESNLGKVL